MEFEKVSEYIHELYKNKPFLSQHNYTSGMELQDYTPTVDDEAAAYLRLILKITQPKRILEIGTSVGFSTASMASVAKTYGGHITTIEFDEKVADQAEKNFLKAGLTAYITVKRGDAREILHDLTEPYDLIFQDVDKRLYPVLLNDCIRLLNKGGILLSDDALFPVFDMEEEWGHLVEPIRQYNEIVMKHPQLDSVLLPIGDGIMMSAKL